MRSSKTEGRAAMSYESEYGAMLRGLRQRLAGLVGDIAEIAERIVRSVGEREKEDGFPSVREIFTSGGFEADMDDVIPMLELQEIGAAKVRRHCDELKKGGRSPLSVMRDGKGRYVILDGDITYHALKSKGSDTVMVADIGGGD